AAYDAMGADAVPGGDERCPIDRHRHRHVLVPDGEVMLILEQVLGVPAGVPVGSATAGEGAGGGGDHGDPGAVAAGISTALGMADLPGGLIASGITVVRPGVDHRIHAEARIGRELVDASQV